MNVSSLKETLTPSSRLEQSSQLESKFEIAGERALKIKNNQERALSTIPGSHMVGIEEMLNIFSENGLISNDERELLTEKITDRSQMKEAILELKGPGALANTAYHMQNGIMLPNGILVPSSYTKSDLEGLASLSEREVGIIETAEGKDMRLGQTNGLLLTVAADKHIGLIQGELGLKDYAMLKKEFEESFKPGSHDKVDMEATFNRLLEALMEDDKKSKTEKLSDSAES